ncbi:DUF3558 domain-containing protein [Nocardia sp. 004]|uniref:DUF3558 domain-containing protein n=1 Tax=Nocardia sp. 004 TaxID=3385978 RepID=UPI0039A03FBD
MRGTAKVFVVAAGLIVGVASAGCGSSAEDDPKWSAVPRTVTESGLLVQVPKGFDPCTDVPQSVLDSERLHAAVVPNRADYDGPGGTRWRGCAWVQSNGYAASVKVTNVTIPYVRSRGLVDPQEFTLAGRAAISTRRGSKPSETCVVNVEMIGGSLEVFLDNPPSRRHTGHLDTCQLARTLAEKVAQVLPAGV